MNHFSKGSLIVTAKMLRVRDTETNNKWSFKN